MDISVVKKRLHRHWGRIGRLRFLQASVSYRSGSWHLIFPTLCIL